MILINATRLLILAAALQQQEQAPAPQAELAPVVQRIATTVQLAAQEYRVGVQGGRVVAPAEIEESLLFLAEARRTAERLPVDAVKPTLGALDQLTASVRRTVDPDSLAASAHALTAGLAERYHVDVDQVPASAPSLARGAQVYQQSCAGCHGLGGHPPPCPMASA